MSSETDERDETNESEAKPTITIAEKQGGDTQTSDAKPTITIAEKDGGE
jgi:hypothetical protein